jgi:hypothetical protein
MAPQAALPEHLDPSEADIARVASHAAERCAEELDDAESEFVGHYQIPSVKSFARRVSTCCGGTELTV